MTDSRPQLRVIDGCRDPNPGSDSEGELQLVAEGGEELYTSYTAATKA